MAADETRVRMRVTEILNLCAPSTYSTTISDRNKTRNTLAIADFVVEAGLEICRAIAERPNEFRSAFLATSSPITASGDPLPAHIGPLDSVRITPYTGATYTIEGARRDRDRVEAWRLNPSKVYDPKNHNTAGSTLAGFYDVWEDKFYFTGESAVIKYAAQPVRADTATKIPDIFEPVWVKLAMGNAAKVGLGGYELALVKEYGDQGRSDLEMFKAGNRQFREVDEPRPVSAMHDLAK
jgi:hypothetical protein